MKSTYRDSSLKVLHASRVDYFCLPDDCEWTLWDTPAVHFLLCRTEFNHHPVYLPIPTLFAPSKSTTFQLYPQHFNSNFKMKTWVKCPACDFLHLLWPWCPRVTKSVKVSWEGVSTDCHWPEHVFKCCFSTPSHGDGSARSNLAWWPRWNMSPAPRRGRKSLFLPPPSNSQYFCNVCVTSRVYYYCWAAVINTRDKHSQEVA